MWGNEPRKSLPIFRQFCCVPALHFIGRPALGCSCDSGIPPRHVRSCDDMCTCVNERDLMEVFNCEAVYRILCRYTFPAALLCTGLPWSLAEPCVRGQSHLPALTRRELAPPSRWTEPSCTLTVALRRSSSNETRVASPLLSPDGGCTCFVSGAPKRCCSQHVRLK